LIYLVITLRRARNQGFLRDWPAKSQLRTIVSIAIPESIREFTMALGYVIFFWIVGKMALASWQQPM
jgi:Na+-driven multidrug efflux pump